MQCADADMTLAKGELSRQDVERHALPSCGRWFWRLRGNGDEVDSAGLEEFADAHPTPAPGATWDNVRNKNAGSKIFGWFSSFTDFARSLLDPGPDVVPHGYELIRKGMHVKAFADFDEKVPFTLAADANVDDATRDLHADARERFREYLGLLEARCSEWLGISPLMYVSDSCRMGPGYYKASFHVTITNIVFDGVNLKDNWMHSLFLIPQSKIKPDPSVYNSDIRSMRSVNNSKKSTATVRLVVDYDLSSAGCVRDSLLPTLVTYLEDCASRLTLDVTRNGKGVVDHPKFQNLFAVKLGKRMRSGEGESSAKESKRPRTQSLEYDSQMSDEQRVWAGVVHGLIQKKLLPQLAVGLSDHQIRVHACSGVDTHSKELRFTTKMINASRFCFLDQHRLNPTRRKVHVSNNTCFFVPSTPYDDGFETPVNETCMSTQCKGQARGVVGYISRRNGEWSIRANPLFLPASSAPSSASAASAVPAVAAVASAVAAVASADASDVVAAVTAADVTAADVTAADVTAADVTAAASAAADIEMDDASAIEEEDDEERVPPAVVMDMAAIAPNVHKWITGLRCSGKAAESLMHIGIRCNAIPLASELWVRAASEVAVSDRHRCVYMSRWSECAGGTLELDHRAGHDYYAELRRMFLLDDRSRVFDERLTYDEMRDFIEYGLGIFAIENPIGYIQSNMEHDSYDVICETKLKVLLRHFQYYEFDKIDDHVPFAARWLNDAKKRYYRRMEFCPRCTVSSKHVFNTFSGFRASKLRSVLPELENMLVRPFCNHLQDVIVGGNAAHAEYLLDYMAALVQRPHIKTQVMVLIFGGQGIGKGSLFDFLRKFVLGEKWTQQVQNVDLDLFGQFSSRENTILLQIDEMDDARKHQSALKNLTTADMLRCEKKNVMKEMAKNYLNVVATTNNLTTIPIEATDRRYAFFQAKLPISDVIPGETIEATQDRRNAERAQYFDMLWGNLNGRDTPRAIYQMLLKRDISKYKSENAFQLHRPKTAFYKAQQTASIDISHRFISALVNTMLVNNHELDRSVRGDVMMTKWNTYVKEKESELVKCPWAPVKHALQSIAGVECKVSNGIKYLFQPDIMLNDLRLKNMHDPEIYLPNTQFPSE